jgi:hypothetical protein
MNDHQPTLAYYIDRFWNFHVYFYFKDDWNSKGKLKQKLHIFSEIFAHNTRFCLLQGNKALFWALICASSGVCRRHTKAEDCIMSGGARWIHEVVMPCSGKHGCG